MSCSLHIAALPLAFPVAAQQDTSSTQTDLVPVMIWTLVVALGAMLVLALGYLYRRTRGEEDEFIPKTIDPYYLQEGHADTHSTGEVHPEMAHDAVGMHAHVPPEPDAPGRGITAPLPHGSNDAEVGAEDLSAETRERH